MLAVGAVAGLETQLATQLPSAGLADLHIPASLNNTQHSTNADANHHTARCRGEGHGGLRGLRGLLPAGPLRRRPPRPRRHAPGLGGPQRQARGGGADAGDPAGLHPRSDRDRLQLHPDPGPLRAGERRSSSQVEFTPAQPSPVQASPGQRQGGQRPLFSQPTAARAHAPAFTRAPFLRAALPLPPPPATLPTAPLPTLLHSPPCSSAGTGATPACAWTAAPASPSGRSWSRGSTTPATTSSCSCFPPRLAAAASTSSAGTDSSYSTQASSRV